MATNLIYLNIANFKLNKKISQFIYKFSIEFLNRPYFILIYILHVK